MLQMIDNEVLPLLVENGYFSAISVWDWCVSPWDAQSPYVLATPRVIWIMARELFGPHVISSN